MRKKKILKLNLRHEEFYINRVLSQYERFLINKVFTTHFLYTAQFL